MPTEPFHGSRVFQSGTPPVFVNFASTAVIGLLCAVNPITLASQFAINRPVLIQSEQDAVGLPQSVLDEIDSIYDQTKTRIVLVMVDQGSDAATLSANAIGSAIQKTGVHAFTKAVSLGMPKPKMLVAPGLMTAPAANGILLVNLSAGGSGYGLATTVTVAGASGGAGALLTPIFGTNGTITGVLVERPGAGYTGALTVTINPNGSGGSGAAATATAGSVLNGVLSEMIVVANQLRAHTYTDGPDGTADQAVVARRLIGSRRVIFCDPKVLKVVNGVTVARPFSSILSGLQAYMDQNFGPHYPASNVEIAGIVGTNRPVDPGQEASFLNENGVVTIINRGKGFMAWGPVTCAVGTKWEFVNVSRVSDLVDESIEDAFFEYVDKPQTLGLLDQMVVTGREALLALENEGIIMAGSVFGLSSRTTPTEGAQGVVKFAVRYQVPAPAYDIRTAAYDNVEVAYDLLYSRVTGLIDTGDLI